MLLLLTTALAGDTRQVTDPSPSNIASIEACYAEWGDHPFADASTQEFTYIEPIIRVMGFGSAEYSDKATDAPTLYLVGLNINDLTRTTYTLNNPNGWYCFYNNVTVTARQEVHMVDGAHIADAKSHVHVLGSGDRGHGGIVVLGAVRVYDL